ncbi:hypothetical protein HY638_04700 [Candidatus Woesearchaeota archaeon]|nr:hypothetical protein [Candidatus Woesearchaeota archaeon]
MIVPKFLQDALTIFLILFGIFLLYQVILKIFGGSWTTEDLVFGFIVVMVGFQFQMNTALTRVQSDLGYLKNQFRALAGDFKEHIAKKH